VVVVCRNGRNLRDLFLLLDVLGAFLDVLNRGLNRLGDPPLDVEGLIPAATDFKPSLIIA